MTAPFPFAPREHVVTNLRAALAAARAEYVEGGCEPAYGLLRHAAIMAICDLASTDIHSWEALRAGLK